MENIYENASEVGTEEREHEDRDVGTPKTGTDIEVFQQRFHTN